MENCVMPGCPMYQELPGFKVTHEVVTGPGVPVPDLAPAPDPVEAPASPQNEGEPQTSNEPSPVPATIPESSEEVLDPVLQFVPVPGLHPDDLAFNLALEPGYQISQGATVSRAEINAMFTRLKIVEAFICESLGDVNRVKAIHRRGI